MKTRYAAILNLVEDSENLLPLTRRRPIASLPFASRYRLIDFPFSSLANAGARSAALFIPGSGRSLYDHIRSGINWGLDHVAGGGVFTHSQINLKSSQDDSGHYDANYYYDHANYLNRSGANYVILTGSRILTNIQVDPMQQYHLDKNSDITVAYKKIPRNEVREDTSTSSYYFNLDNGVSINAMQSLSEIPNNADPVSVGLDFLLARKDVFLEYLEELRERNLVVSVENVVKIALEKEEDSINGYEYTGYMKILEDIQSYFEANMDMLDEDNFDALFYRESPVLTKSKNSAPTYYGKDSNVTRSLFANDSQIYGTVEHSLVSRRNFICQDAVIQNSIVLQSSFVDESAKLNYVILDKRVHVEKDAVLEGTPDNPIVVPKEARVLSSGEIVEG